MNDTATSPIRRLAAAAAMALMLCTTAAHPSLAQSSDLEKSARATLLALGLGLLALDALIDKARDLLRQHPRDHDLGNSIGLLQGDQGSLEEARKILEGLIRGQIAMARYRDWCEEYGSESQQTAEHLKVMRQHLRQMGYSDAAVAQIEQNSEDLAREMRNANEECRKAT